jgi:hypothetical protein
LEVEETSAAFEFRLSRMTDLPQIDPNWTRRPRPPAKDDSLVWHILVTLIVLCLLVWIGRAHFEFENARKAAEVQSRGLAAEARMRQQSELALGRDDVHYISEAEANRQLAAASTPGDDDRIHRCVSRSADTYQLGPCRAPLVEAGYAPVNSRQGSVAEQTQMQWNAEAKLRAEEQRFAELTGQSAPSWQPGYSSSPRELARQRCAMVKAERDEAYRLVGNNRTLDFIRSWDDAVYEACKAT